MIKRENWKIAIVDKDDDEKTRQYWMEKSPEERLSAVELLREVYYNIQGYKSVPRTKRELKIVERSD